MVAKKKAAKRALPVKKIIKEKAPAKSAVEKPTAKSVAGVFVDDMTKRRQLKRRCSDEQAHRYIERKLGHVDPSVVKTVRNKDGQSVIDFVKAEMKRKRCVQGRLSSAFACSMFDSFGLANSTWDDLPAPPAAETNEELYEYVSACHDENKFRRNVKPLCSWLDSAGPLDVASFHALLSASLPGPLLDPANSVKIHIAILGFIGRHQLHVQLPGYWTVIEKQMDNSLKRYFEHCLSDGVSMKSFLKTERGVLALFLDDNIITDLIAADGDYTGRSTQVKAIMDSTFQTGISMFKDHWLGCANRLYEEDVAACLKQLEHNDFAEDECSHYTTICIERVKHVKKLGSGRKLKWKYVFELYGTPMDAMTVDDPRDAALFSLRNRLKDIALNNGQVVPFWWERLLLPIGSMNGVPIAVKISDAWIAKLQPVRDFCMDIVQGVSKISEVIKKVEKSRAILTHIDRSFECDINFITNHLASLLRAKADDAIVACMPADGPTANFAATLENIRAIRDSHIVAALPDQYVDEIDGVHDTIMNLSAGQPPQDKDVNKASPLTKLVLARAPLFCSYVLSKEELKARGKFWKSPMVYGLEAVQCRFRMLEDIKNKTGWLDLLNLQPVKQYKWLLDDSQRVTFAQWLKMVVPAHIMAAPALTPSSSAPSDQSSAIVAASSALRASSIAIACGSASSSSAGAKQKADDDIGQLANKAMLAKFFNKSKSV